MIEDLKGDESWCMFRIISQFNADTIAESDFDFITLTDDVEEVVKIMTDHRRWKHEQSHQAKRTTCTNTSAATPKRSSWSAWRNSATRTAPL